jgi:hypothetical protein
MKSQLENIVQYTILYLNYKESKGSEDRGKEKRKTEGF